MSSFDLSSYRLNRKDKGFTLIEMVLVLSLIGILISAAVYGFIGYQRMTNNSVAAQNYAKLMTAKIAYCSQQNTAGGPITLANLAPYLNDGSATPNLNISGVSPTFTPTNCGAAGTVLSYISPTPGILSGIFGNSTAAQNITCIAWS